MEYPDNPIYRGRDAAHTGAMLTNVRQQELNRNRIHREPLAIYDDRPDEKDLISRCREVIRAYKDKYPNWQSHPPAFIESNLQWRQPVRNSPIS